MPRALANAATLFGAIAIVLYGTMLLFDTVSTTKAVIGLLAGAVMVVAPRSIGPVTRLVGHVVRAWRTSKVHSLLVVFGAALVLWGGSFVLRGYPIGMVGVVAGALAAYIGISFMQMGHQLDDDSRTRDRGSGW